MDYNEDNVLFMKLNQYQTKLDEALKDQMPRDAWNDMIEFIDTVPMIQWLMSSDEVRGYAKDRPRDEDGKIEVDLTKPHLLQDMDYFRERAIYFDEHGRYTDIRPNRNPKSDYARFWKEEQRRWKEGYVREVDGEWIPGLYYFYLNYSPIFINEKVSDSKDSKKAQGVRLRKFPKIWLGDYMFYHYVAQAKMNGHHCKLLKTRGVGFSYKTAAMSPCNMYVEKGLPNFHLASDKTFLEGEKGVFGKVVDVLDWMADNTPMAKMRIVNKGLEKQLGYTDEYGIKKGYKSSVYGISLKDNPDKARGVRGPLIHYEEDGLFPNLETAWNVNRKAVEDGDIVYGMMFAGGCLTKNNFFHKTDGSFIKADEISKDDEILGFDKERQCYSRESIVFNNTSSKPCFRITTNAGRWIECSYDHPLLWSKLGLSTSKELPKVNGSRRRKFMKKTEFKLASELKVGEQLATINEMNIFSNKEMWNPRLVGWLIGDGSYGKNKTPIISNCEPEINSWIHSNCDYVTEKTYITKLNKVYEENRIKGICWRLRELGIYGQTKSNKRLPENMHTYSKNTICELIGGFFDADGYVSKAGAISLSSGHKEILIEVMLLLQKLGIHCNINFKKPNSKNPKSKNGHYDLEIKDKSSVLNFREHIKLWPAVKAQRLDECITMYSNRDSLNAKHLSGLRFERIIDIEDIGVQQVYNVTANTTNTYISNGLISKNTGGTEGANFAGSEKLFYSPGAYNIQGMRNVFDKNAAKTSSCGFFWGAYLNRAQCYDESTGEPDVVKALMEVLVDRELVKRSSSDPLAITQKKAEEPIVPQEAVMRTSGTIFPISDLKDCKESIMAQGEAFFNSHYVGELFKDPVEGVVWRANADKYPIRKFPHSNNKIEGALEIFEMPKKTNGKTIKNRYIAGIDPVDDDYSTTVSLPSIFVLDLFTDKIVLEYTGRPQFADDFYLVVENILELYNATALYENDKKGLFRFFDYKHKLHLLADTPQHLRDMDIIKGATYGNKAKGVNSSKIINAYGRRLYRDWLLTTSYTQTYDEEGNQVGERLNMHDIRSICLLEETIQWNNDANFDRVSALGMLMIYRAEMSKYLEGIKEESQQSSRTGASFDEYFTRSFPGAQ